MRMYGCDYCCNVFTVVDDPIEVHRLIVEHPMWRKGMKCPCCTNPLREVPRREQAKVRNTKGMGVVTFHDLDAEQFFRALCGFGLPNEIGTEPEVVAAMLLSSKIEDVEVGLSPSDKVTISRIDLSNGVSLHLAGGVAATIFKITRRQHDPDVERHLSELQAASGDDTVRDGSEGGGGDAGGEAPPREGAGEAPDVEAGGHGGDRDEDPSAPSEVPCCEGADEAAAIGGEPVRNEGAHP